MCRILYLGEKMLSYKVHLIYLLFSFVMNVTDITFLFPQSSLCEVSDRIENQVL